MLSFSKYSRMPIKVLPLYSLTVMRRRRPPSYNQSSATGRSPLEWWPPTNLPIGISIYISVLLSGLSLRRLLLGCRLRTFRTRLCFFSSTVFLELGRTALLPWRHLVGCGDFGGVGGYCGGSVRRLALWGVLVISIRGDATGRVRH